jgi:hypothetical protein
MLAHGYWLGAIGVLALAKAVSLGVTAFVFALTRPKLLQMDWFRPFYEWVMRSIACAHALIDPIKRQLKILFRMFSPRRASRTFKLLRRIRHRMQARATAWGAQNRCTACGAKNPIDMNTNPRIPSPPAR